MQLFVKVSVLISKFHGKWRLKESHKWWKQVESGKSLFHTICTHVKKVLHPTRPPTTPLHPVIEAQWSIIGPWLKMNTPVADFLKTYLYKDALTKMNMVYLISFNMHIWLIVGLKWTCLKYKHSCKVIINGTRLATFIMKVIYNWSTLCFPYI